MYSLEVIERIRLRAYEIYEYCRDQQLTVIVDQLGNLRHRTAQDDWTEAEHYVLNEIEQEQSDVPKNA